MADPLLAKIARQHGGKLLDAAVTRLLPVSAPGKAGLVGKIAGAALLRVATKSVPGAIIVGGGLLAKTLYDRKKAAPDANVVKAAGVKAQGVKASPAKRKAAPRKTAKAPRGTKA